MKYLFAIRQRKVLRMRFSYGNVHYYFVYIIHKMEGFFLVVVQRHESDTWPFFQVVLSHNVPQYFQMQHFSGDLIQTLISPCSTIKWVFRVVMHFAWSTLIENFPRTKLHDEHLAKTRPVQRTMLCNQDSKKRTKH